MAGFQGAWLRDAGRSPIHNEIEKRKMTNRNPVVVLILAMVTCGIYGVVWYVKTKGEMKAQGADIPTAWLLIVPIGNLFWLWKWASGVQQITAFGAAGAFVLCLFLGPIGMAVVQSQFNKVTAGAAPQPPAA
jgi:hypothetical protein